MHHCILQALSAVPAVWYSDLVKEQLKARLHRVEAPASVEYHQALLTAGMLTGTTQLCWSGETYRPPEIRVLASLTSEVQPPASAVGMT